MLIALLAAAVSFDAAGQALPKLDHLIVYGEGFRFSVKEPHGWCGDTSDAERYSANVIFYAGSAPLAQALTVIRVRIADKTDENIQEDLASDMKDYQAKYPKVVFRDFRSTHPEYGVVSKLFTVPGQFYEYVAYVNPGSSKKTMFSVSMNTERMEATSDQLDAFRSVLSSLVMF